VKCAYVPELPPTPSTFVNAQLTITALNIIFTQQAPSTMSAPTSMLSVEKQGGVGSAYNNEQGRAFQGAKGAPPFQWSHLFGQPIINPVNLKSYTLPIFSLSNPYSRSFHLSWCESRFSIDI